MCLVDTRVRTDNGPHLRTARGRRSSRSNSASKCNKVRNNNSNCTFCATSSRTSKPSTTFAVVAWASSTALTTSLRFGRREDANINELRTYLMLYLRVHSVLRVEQLSGGYPP